MLPSNQCADSFHCYLIQWPHVGHDCSIMQHFQGPAGQGLFQCLHRRAGWSGTMSMLTYSDWLIRDCVNAYIQGLAGEGLCQCLHTGTGWSGTVSMLTFRGWLIRDYFNAYMGWLVRDCVNAKYRLIIGSFSMVPL